MVGYILKMTTEQQNLWENHHMAPQCSWATSVYSIPIVLYHTDYRATMRNCDRMYGNELFLRCIPRDWMGYFSKLKLLFNIETSYFLYLLFCYYLFHSTVSTVSNSFLIFHIQQHKPLINHSLSLQTRMELSRSKQQWEHFTPTSWECPHKIEENFNIKLYPLLSIMDGLSKSLTTL